VAGGTPPSAPSLEIERTRCARRSSRRSGRSADPSPCARWSSRRAFARDRADSLRSPLISAQRTLGGPAWLAAGRRARRRSRSSGLAALAAHLGAADARRTPGPCEPLPDPGRGETNRRGARHKWLDRVGSLGHGSRPRRVDSRWPSAGSSGGGATVRTVARASPTRLSWEASCAPRPLALAARERTKDARPLRLTPWHALELRPCGLPAVGLDIAGPPPIIPRPAPQRCGCDPDASLPWPPWSDRPGSSEQRACFGVAPGPHERVGIRR
jgi:hypothetical protein